jgi:hypothetical protein
MLKILFIASFVFVNLYSSNKLNDSIIKKINNKNFDKKEKMKKLNVEEDFFIKSQNFIYTNNEINEKDDNITKYKKEISKSIRRGIVNLELLNNISHGELYKDNENILLKNKMIVLDNYVFKSINRMELDSIFMFYTMEVTKININEELKSIIIEKEK